MPPDIRARARHWSAHVVLEAVVDVMTTKGHMVASLGPVHGPAVLTKMEELLAVLVAAEEAFDQQFKAAPVSKLRREAMAKYQIPQ